MTTCADVIVAFCRAAFPDNMPTRRVPDTRFLSCLKILRPLYLMGIHHLLELVAIVPIPLSRGGRPEPGDILAVVGSLCFYAIQSRYLVANNCVQL